MRTNVWIPNTLDSFFSFLLYHCTMIRSDTSVESIPLSQIHSNADTFADSSNLIFLFNGINIYYGLMLSNNAYIILVNLFLMKISTVK